MSPKKIKLEIILLAAGLSSRMGPRNKLLMPFKGKPLVHHVATQLLKSNLGPVTVITGFEDAKVRHALKGLDLNFLHNTDFQAGQMSSVQYGVKNLKPHTEGVMIALADMPYLTGWDYQTIAKGFEQEARDKIIVPYFTGERGNPIIIPNRLFGDISSGSLKSGCKRLIEKRPMDVHKLEIKSRSHIADIDTPHDYSNWQQQFIVLPACC